MAAVIEASRGLHELKDRPLTVSHIFGELVCLMAASDRHSVTKAAYLPELLIPPINLKQFHLFRDGMQTVGAAIWARFDEESEAFLKHSLEQPIIRLMPGQWNSGDRLWLLELIAPYANNDNKHVDVMMADLISGPFRDQEFHMLSFNSADSSRAVVHIGSDASMKLREAAREEISRLGGGL